MVLSAKQLSDYERDGFLVLREFVSPDACNRLRRRANELIAEFDPGDVVSIFSTHEQSRKTDDYFMSSADKIHFFFEEDAFAADGSLKQTKERSINKIGHALHDLDRDFSDFSRTDAIRQLVSDLSIEQPLLLQSMYIFKQPNIGGEVNCHQDSTFLYTEPIAIVGLWFAIEDATVENGCLWVLPGGHKCGLKSRWRRTTEGMQFESLNSDPWPESELTPLPVKAGSLILLHGLLPHLSRENKSERSRHAYTLHVIDGNCDYAADNWLQRSRTMPLRGF